MQISTRNSASANDAKYDILKIILAIMVVAMHSEIYPMILYPWLRIAVPLFFMMTSYFTFQKMQNAPLEMQKQIMRRFILRNVRLYVFWFVVFMPIILPFRIANYFSSGIITGICRFLQDLLFGETFAASWYITASVIGMVIIWWLSVKVHKLAALVIAVVAFGVVTLWSSYQPILSEHPAVVQFMQWYIRHFGNPVFSFPVSLVWLLIGKGFAEKRNKTLPAWLLWIALIFSAAGLYLEWKAVQNLTGIYWSDSLFMLIPLCAALFSLVQRIPPIRNIHTKHLRRASTVMYVSHFTMIPLIRYFGRRFLQIDADFFVFAVTIGCCCVLYLAIERIQRWWPNSKISALLKNAY